MADMSTRMNYVLNDGINRLSSQCELGDSIEIVAGDTFKTDCEGCIKVLTASEAAHIAPKSAPKTSDSKETK